MSITHKKSSEHRPNVLSAVFHLFHFVPFIIALTTIMCMFGATKYVMRSTESSEGSGTPQIIQDGLRDVDATTIERAQLHIARYSYLNEKNALKREDLFRQIWTYNALILASGLMLIHVTKGKKLA